MKKKFKLSILATLMCFSISGIIQAATQAEKKTDKELSVVEHFEKDTKKKYPNLEIKQITPEESIKIKEEMRTKVEKEAKQEVQLSGISAFDSAPPVTVLYIDQIVWDEPNGHKYIYGDLTAPAIKGYTEMSLCDCGCEN
ncbi:hypothetical protein P4S93_02615 [Aneurinibacillus thermoaerophilus]|uniref:Uncharacterized protein n=1 Tax=Aneurinibacillus thermoaerophilus TaxID=143495 RepID=A0A1G7YAP0_ANETH|nr:MULTISPECIES: hypothetical protein [Aneurinibacillus]AMA72162.1 hypothetical protein ACH33_04370 [Aneurinibacillus sp. XH2]MED0676449.1 hypothetical protein [Aneurinibacillus thermoaerophilus]MED0756001.1 hypothetical protein [Aneurinibacillus thermoaerophilus]MED0759675.1 hypothetical protein [Aneurinibacillus thermoaerophilus]QYY42070.1 hypothetical protein K3F53_14530 [Aneurinibacillus thermoaerophilus]